MHSAVLEDQHQKDGESASLFAQSKYTLNTRESWWQFAVTNVVTILIPLWGMVGIWTHKFGFHNTWEFWYAFPIEATESSRLTAPSKGIQRC